MNLYKECRIKKYIEITSFYTAFEASFDSSYFFDGETHDFWELVYVKEGSVGIVADEKIYSLSECQMILHPPMQFHRIWSANNSTPTVIIISFSANWRVMPENCVFDISKEQENGLIEILGGIHKSFFMENRNVAALKDGHGKDAQISTNRLENLLLSLKVSKNFGREDNIDAHNKKYAEIIKVLSDNLDKNLTLDDIAEKCNMSVSNLKKVFFRYSGMGIKHYYNEMKARQAAQYLHDGYTVKETAAMLGFSDQNYFSMFFKRIMGESPTNYLIHNKNA